MAGGLTDDIKDVASASSDLERALSAGSRAIDDFSRAGFKNSDVLGSMVNAMDDSKGAVIALSSSMSHIPLFGDLMKPGLEAVNAMTTALGSAVKGALDMVQGYDALDAGLRDFQKGQWALAAGIGATFAESEKFKDSYREILKINSDLSRQGLYIGDADVKKAIETMQKAGVEIDVLGAKTKIFGTEMTFAQGMAAQAKEMGMDVASYSNKIAAMVRTNGMSMEESMNLMANSQDIARNTGLTVDEVTGSLDKATSGFARMGMTMDFGRPILKGFADSVKDVGLGIQQAAGLAEAFTGSLAKIIDNPALAYITSMKGGMAGMGGGGILNPSIQMQATMLEGDAGDKAKMAKDLSEGMRDTLKSFTGGDIITIKQAAESPELQTKFYTQQQMLGSTYGINDSATQNQVLQYLSQLEDATYAGDEKSAELLQKQISDALQGTDKTTSLQEKMSLNMEKSVMFLEESVQLSKMNFASQFEREGKGAAWDKILALMDKISAPGATKEDQDSALKALTEATSHAASTSATTTVGAPTMQTGVSGAPGTETATSNEKLPALPEQVITVYVKADPGYAATWERPKTSAASSTLNVKSGGK